MFGPFHRLGDSQEVIRKIRESGELWGAAPRNSFQSAIAKVKGYAGPLLDGAQGFEFETEVQPDPGHVPAKPTWSPGPDRPDVAFDGTYAKIKIIVLKIQ